MPDDSMEDFDPARLPIHPRAGRVYGPTFWLAYLSNALTMIAISMLVRYADFVTYLGGAEGQLGLIVGVGMIGSLAMRFGQGVGIDRYGPRTIWLVSLVFFVGSLVAHLAVDSATGPAVFAVRILMQTSIAGIFGASITYISLRVPPARMAEIIGTLGTSGFIGILVGPLLGDLIFAQSTGDRVALDRMFLTAAGLAVLALISTWFATRGICRSPARRRPPALALIRRYHPGTVLLVAAAVGAGISVPNTFLRTYASELGIPQIGLFFATYAIVAFIVRMSTRRLFERFGTRFWVLCGLLLMASSMLLYLIVSRVSHLIIPGIAVGAAHALLFPSVVAGGSTVFPQRYRGLGTTLMLAMFDMGSFVGAPLVGGILHFARRNDWPAYPTMFATVAAGLIAVAFVFASFPGKRSAYRVTARPDRIVRRRPPARGLSNREFPRRELACTHNEQCSPTQDG